MYIELGNLPNPDQGLVIVEKSGFFSNFAVLHIDKIERTAFIKFCFLSLTKCVALCKIRGRPENLHLIREKDFFSEDPKP